MIKILNQNRQPVAILENAYDISFEKQFNSLWTASFSLSLNDEKNEHCKPLYFVEVYDNGTLAEDGNIDGDYVGLFRIMPKLTVKNESANTVTYQCEHVMGMLLNSSLFQDHQLTNLTTRESLQYLIDRQKVKHFTLGRVEFVRYFSYLWENENLLSAIFSVPKPFDVPYMWSVDTTSYPWKLELLAPETEPTAEIREGKNLRGLEVEENPMDIYNRIYPLGEGEGINQLNIKSVNNGIPYVEDATSIADNGPIEYIWPDRRFIDPITLKASAEALLKKWKEPIVTWKVSAADISSITGESIDKFRVGKVVRLNVEGFPTTDLRIMKESKSDVTGNPGDITLEIGSVVEDLGTTQADIRQRQRINELYAQGAVNLGTYSFNDNCDPDDPAIIRFYLPDEMAKINKLWLSYKTTNFRAYSKAAKAGGGQTTTSGGGQTTSAGGGQTTSSGGGQTTSSGGGQTSSAGGDHTHKMFSATGFSAASDPNNSVALRCANNMYVYVDSDTAAGIEYYTEGSSGSHTHTVAAHTHTVANHTHSVSDHTHSVADHSHEVSDHTHPLEYGIYKHPDLPTSITIKVDGNAVPGSSLEAENLDLIPYLSKDTEGKIIRGWHEITLFPNGLGRINANVISQFFMRSRGGGDF